MDAAAAHAFVRFGLGRRGDEPAPSDPRRWLLGQLQGADPGVAGAPGTAEGLTAVRNDRQNQPAAGEREAPKLAQAARVALVEYALSTPTPFRERLVWFWTNHFTVSIRQAGVGPIAVAFMQEAIRPHVTGRFGDMLLAVMRHPAMLIYLDNARSFGPDSMAGERTKRGLNENLARECMELHTMGADSGYTQADVTSFAKLITGWSVDLQADPPGFLFRPRAHEPGPQTVLGRTFPDGEEGGVAALAFFADHPATHRKLATKLVRHFVADDPPPDAVRRIEGALRDTQGDLGAATSVLVGMHHAWETPLAKFRPPQDYVLAVLRAADLPDGQGPDGQVVVGLMRALGQPLFEAPLPNGWSDRAADWAGPEELMRRIDWAYGFSGRLGHADPAQVAQTALGPLLHPATLDAVGRAGSRREAMTLLLTAPEFQRR
ncbi:MAG TPA: DUF1800 domain-containing protein [Acidisphaera sp.]|nr:DUF1800 domain-containing protein [Acidisphaera sp.]